MAAFPLRAAGSHGLATPQTHPIPFFQLPDPTSNNSLTCASAHEQQASTNYKEAFSLYDKRGTGRVPADSLGDLLRACGQNPTLAEIGELEKGVGKECK